MGDNSKLWETVREIGASLSGTFEKIARIEKVLTSIPALLAPPDVTTREGHAKLSGTLTKGTITSAQSQDALLYRQLENGNWELTDVTVKIYDCGFICGASLPVDTIIRWKAFGRKRYYDGGV